MGSLVSEADKRKKSLSLWWNPVAEKYGEWLSYLSKRREDPAMRKFIRHPSDIPIDFKVDECSPATVYKMKDISEGGLCFKTDREMTRGLKIQIHIPLAFQMHATGETSQGERFEANGIVAWCKKETEGYAVGVQFLDPDTQFGVRMVEQVCHIEHYRYDVLQAEGRSLTSEQAALEWVERYAAEFPAVS